VFEQQHDKGYKQTSIAEPTERGKEDQARASFLHFTWSLAGTPYSLAEPTERGMEQHSRA
jgi:hypothetical protein